MVSTIYLICDLQILDLEICADTLVGDEMLRGISGRQRKRVTTGKMLIGPAKALFMDGISTGLDSSTTVQIMKCLRQILFLLKRGGQEIYVDPLGRHSYQLINYFESVKGVNKIRDGCNPATWMLEITTPAREMDLNVDFSDIYKNSELYRRNKDLVAELSKPAPGSKELSFPTQYAQPFFIQSLMFGTMFWDLGSKTTRKQDLFNAIGSMYNAVLFNLGSRMILLFSQWLPWKEPSFIEKGRPECIRPSHVFSQVLIELPYILAQAVTYGLIVYAMIGFDCKFFWYIFFMYFTFYGMMAVAITNMLLQLWLVHSMQFGISSRDLLSLDKYKMQ
ncbi:hypothetical protein Ahy_A07g037322 [Arachis hypogaea]|uniref:ABC-2 type transporter transmembrane domain-containing protein n=1 Tax=Arachis hypogaea TaxID=3818 RepID=A0A445CID7_ARAHY|nr:hypothetical protein Ahy_A07g037322 [Arachis hypogaea]